jgi:two-component system chemotaxis response regulator CheB
MNERNLRVLVVDDSAVVRRMVTKLLEAERGIEVVGVAADGASALERLAACAPDVITLDLDMPGMDGLTALPELKRAAPEVPVVILSSFSEEGAEITLKALSLGASDYVTKPKLVRGEPDSLAPVAEQLVTKLRALCVRGDAAPAAVAPQAPLRACNAIVIGTSTGGPRALEVVLGALPNDLGVPVVVVQHMPPLFTRKLAASLDERCGLTVREAEDGVRLKAGVVWLAPGDFHVELRREAGAIRLALHQGEKENACRPALDPLFRSAAKAYGPGTLAVVMTGMGIDGTAGARAIRAAGGQVIAQDRASSVVWSMPASVADAGLADAVLPLSRIAGALDRAARAARLCP